MNRAETLESLIKSSGNHLKCRDIWERHDGLSLKTTQAASELRDKLAPEGKTVVHHKEETPSDSWYSIENVQIEFLVDKQTNQMVFNLSEAQDGRPAGF